MGCGGLDESGPRKHLCFNIWSAVDGTAWEGLGDVALLEELCHWGWALGFQKTCVVHLLLAV